MIKSHYEYAAASTGSAKMIIETERLFLREMTPDDLPVLRSMLQDDEVMASYNGAFSDEEVLSWLDRTLARYQKDGYALWAVVLKESGRMIGQCGLTNQEPKGKTLLEVGYLFLKEYWHQGYAIEAATACKEYAFSTIGADELYSIIRCSNRASIAVAKRLQMFCTEYFVKHYRGIDMPHFLYRIRRDEKLEIAYLADFPEHIPTCTSWIYGMWGSQSGGAYERTLQKMTDGAGKDSIPITLIAFNDKKPAGTVSLWANDASIPDLTPWMAAVYVHPFHRGLKISLALVDRLIDEARRLNFKEIYLYTGNAQDLYRKFGWEEISIVDSPYGISSLMRLDLTK